MPELPTLGSQPRRSSLPGLVAAAVVGGALVAVVFWLRDRNAAAPASQPAAQLEAAAPSTAAGSDAGPESIVRAAAADAGEASLPPAAAKVGLKAFSATLNGPLESAIVEAVGKETGAPLTQVVNRSLVWWLRIPQDLLKGDALSVIYEERAGEEPLVHAVRFTSRKLGKTFEAYRYQATEAPFPRFFQPDGTELEAHLVDGPLDSWEQITSLLRDGRRHQGVDFKTPVGTPVKATFSGVVVRKNWNFRGNGNCLEIQESGGQGRTAVFLHLSELPKSLQSGSRVVKGEVVARSGNTGHSFAPHLHYQLMKSGRVIDPFDSHQTIHQRLPQSERARFDAAMARLQAILPKDSAAGG
jgi:murein DD-endopeptidase